MNKNENKSINVNIVLLPFSIFFVLFIYVFVSLIGTDIFYKKPIYITIITLLLVWLLIIFFLEKKHNTIKNNPKMFLFVFLMGIILGFFYVNQIWFSGYLNLLPLNSFFSGKTHRDTLYLTTIAESFSTNGYPSFLINEAPFIKYHYLSNLFISVISRILDIPCFITYNYLFHIIILPVFILLLQIIVIDIRNEYGIQKQFQYIDYIFITCFLMGFNFVGLADSIAHWYNSMIVSESCLMSIMFLLFAIKIVFVCKREYESRVLLKVLFIPFFIIILSGLKVSTGCIFFVLCSYYLFRKKIFDIKTWVLIIVYSIIFLLSCKLFIRTDDFSYMMQTNENFGILSKIHLFDFCRRYVGRKNLLLHYWFYLIPFCFIFLFQEKKINSFKMFIQNDDYISKSVLITMIAALIPGLILNIDAGNAFYFIIPSFVLLNLLILGKNIPYQFFSEIKGKHLILSFILVSLFIPEMIKSNIPSTIRELYSCKTSYNDLMSDEAYNSYVEILSLTKGSKDDYCIMLSENAYIIKTYDERSDKIPRSPNNLIELAATGLYGINLINNEHDINYAKALGKKKMILIIGDSYKIIDL